ncbi:glycosyltransferase family 4 protein [Flavobacterium suncheonense]|uniref:Glycosyl transferase family 1 domain-containing protein n=1 Tax=Flavobacterium suncheonense GH29-5 = DSM 17707 TaxID=1121899 RepID=A0A0A2MEP4_9FLAO|nr:glycosyltransferase family 4 protein [Flavobacterium suncheonense]KGO90081.1 hypothetical protein Q764_03160 [Flavobacterium suncheonense GH29-5 = DSM 17707]
MKVLLINNFSIENNPGGVENYLLELTDYAQRSNTDITFKWFGKGNKKTHWFQKLHNREVTKEIIAEIDSFQPDLIHCFSIGAPITPHFMNYAKSKSIPVLQSFRDYYYICPKNYMLTDSGKIIERHENALECIFYHHPRRNIVFDSLLYLKQQYHKRIINKNICYFLSPSDNLTQFIRKHFNVPGRTLPNPVLLSNPSLETASDYLLYVGRLDREKGVLTLLKAFQNVVLRFPNEKLLIAGSGAEKDVLLNYVETNKIPNVRFLGAQNRDQLKKLYAKAKFTLVPSEFLESYGNVILESFAFHKTVIISSLLGLVDEVASNHCGLIFPYGDDTELAKKMELLLVDKTLRFELETNAYSYVQNKSFSNHFKELRAIYIQILKDNQPTVSINSSKSRM